MTNEKSHLLGINPVATVLSCKQRSVTDKIIALPYDVATCPSVLLGAGNCLYTWPNNLAGFGLAVAETIGAALCAGYESWTEIPKGLPAYAVAGVNAVTSLSYFSDINGPDLLNFGKEAWNNLYSGTAFALWTAGNTARGMREGKGKHVQASMTENLSYGGGDICAIHGHPWVAIPFAIGIAKTFYEKYHPTDATRGFWQRTAKSLTSQRLYGIGYGVSSALLVMAAHPLTESMQTSVTSPNLFIAGAQALWAVFYFRVGKPAEPMMPIPRGDKVTNPILKA